MTSSIRHLSIDFMMIIILICFLFLFEPVTSATLSGSLPNSREKSVVTGGTSVTISVSSTFLSTLTDLQLVDLVDGMTSSTATTYGWNAIVKPLLKLHPEVFSLSSNRQSLTISMPAIPSYSIFTHETVSVTVPASVLTSSIAETASTINILADPGVVTLTATVVVESEIVAGGKTITLSIIDDSLVSPISTTLLNTLIDEFSSSSSASGGWTTVISPLLKTNQATSITINASGTLVSIVLPAAPSYTIDDTEYITVTVPSSLLNNQASSIASPLLTVKNTVGTVTLTGTLSSGTTETQIRQGGKTVILTLANDRFILLQDVSFKTLLINAIVSGGSETNGWNAAVKTALVADLSKIGVDSQRSVVTLSLPPVSSYSIQLSETLTFSIPSAIISSATVINIATTIIINNDAGSVAITGDVGIQLESAIIAGGKSYVITLTDDSFLLPLSTTMKQALITGFLSAQNESNGWNIQVVSLLKSSLSSVVSSSSQIVTITLPAVSLYDISYPETITVTVPQGCVSSGVDLVMASSVLTIKNMPGALTFGGTLVSGGATEANIVLGGKTITLQLSGDTFVTPFDSNAKLALLNTLTVQSNEAQGFENKILLSKLLKDLSLTTLDATNRIVTLALPATAIYSITDSEVLSITPYIPSSLVTSSQNLITASKLTIANDPGTAAMTGSIVNVVSMESMVTTGTKDLIITLTNDHFMPFSSSSAINTFISGLASSVASSDDSRGWNAIVIPFLKSNPLLIRLQDLNRQVALVTIPAITGYDSSGLEVIKMTIPAASVSSGVAIVATGLISIRNTKGTAVLSTSIQSQSSVVGSGYTITITLSQDAWVDDASLTSQLKTSIVTGITSAQNEATGWNIKGINTLKSNLSRVVVTDSARRILTISLQTPEYVITAPETLSAVIPLSAVTSQASDIAVSGTVTINAVVAVLSLGGNFVTDSSLRSATVAKSLRQRNAYITITVTGDSFVPLTSAPQAQSIINALTVSGAATSGFSATIKSQLQTSDVVGGNGPTITIYLPDAPSYAISISETITIVNLPGSIFQSSAGPVSCTDTIVITVNPPTVTITGNLIDDPTRRKETMFRLARDQGSVITLTLANGYTWVNPFTSQLKSLLLTSLASSGSESNGFLSQIKSKLSAVDVSDPGNSYTSITIALPNAPLYQIRQSENISLQSLSATLFTSGVSASTINAIPIVNESELVVSGSLVLTETAVRTGDGSTLTLTLIDDTFKSWASISNSDKNTIISNLGFSSSIITGLQSHYTSISIDASLVTLTLKFDFPISSYSISTPESVTVTVHPLAFSTRVYPLSGSPIVIIKNDVGSVTLSGSALSTTFNEANIVSGGSTLILTLQDDFFISTPLSSTVATAVVNGFVSSSSSLQTGWTEIVVPGLKSSLSSLVVNSDLSTLTVTFPALASYNVDRDETITITIPSSAFVSSTSNVVVATKVTVRHRTGTLSVSGSALSATITENDIKNGGKILIFTLSDELFVSTITNDIKTAIIDGITTSASSQWQTLVLPALKLSLNNIVRASDTVLTITLPTVLQYNIAVAETVILNIAASGVFSGVTVVSNQNLVIYNTVGYARLVGTLNYSKPSSVVAGGMTLIIEVFEDSFITLTDQIRTAVIDGMVSAITTATNWVGTVVPALKNNLAVVTLNSDKNKLTVTMPAISSYSISTEDIITITLPASSLSSSCCTITVAPRLTIVSSKFTLTLVSSLLTDTGLATETKLRNAGTNSIIISLVLAGGDTYTSLSTASSKQLVIDSLTSTPGETTGLAALKAVLQSSSVARVSDTRVDITLVNASSYSISSAEVIKVSGASATLFTSGNSYDSSNVITIISDPTSLSLAGTLVSDGSRQTEEKLKTALTDGTTLVLMLSNGDSWNRLTTITSKQLVISSLSSTQAEPGGFLNTIRNALQISSVSQPSVDGTSVTITLPNAATYSIAVPESISVQNLSPTLVASGQSYSSINVVVIKATVGVLKFDGKLVASALNRVGSVLKTAQTAGFTILLTLTGDRWNPFCSEWQTNVLSKLTSNQDTANSFLQAVKPNIIVQNFVNLPNGASTLTLLLPNAPNYLTTQPETIQFVNLPGILFESAQTTSSDTLVFNNSPSLATLGGNFVTSASNQYESKIRVARTLGLVITVTLIADQFVFTSSASKQTVIYSFQSNKQETNGWLNTVKAQLSTSDISDPSSDKSTITISLPNVSAYDISVAEVISLVIPKDILMSNSQSVSTGSVTVSPVSGSVTLGGNLITNINLANEGTLRTGATSSLSLTLTIGDGESWVTLSTQLKQSLLSSFRSDRSETGGFVAKIIPAFTTAMVSDAISGVVTVSFPDVSSYDIIAPEALSLDLPGTLFTLQNRYILNYVTIQATAGTIAVGGSLKTTASLATQPNLRQAGTLGTYIELTLTGDTWVPFSSPVQRQHIIDSIVSSGTEAGGFVLKIKPKMTPNNVNDPSNSSKTIKITLPNVSDYTITTPEEIRFSNIPKDLFTSHNTYSISVGSGLTLKPPPGTVTLTGTLVSVSANQIETKIRTASTSGVTLAVSIASDSWLPLDTDAKKLLVINSLTSSNTEAGGFLAKVVPALLPSMVSGTSSVLTVNLPNVATYDIMAPEAIGFKLLDASLSSTQSIYTTSTITIAAATASQGGEAAVNFSGNLVTDSSRQLEYNVRTANSLGTVLTLTLTGDRWVSLTTSMKTSIIAAMTSTSTAQTEPMGFLAVIKPLLTISMLTVSADATALTIALPNLPSYDIVNDETISIVNIPADTRISSTIISSANTVTLLRFMAKPAAPSAPIVSDITRVSMKLSWLPSGDNGGSAITGFRVYTKKGFNAIDSGKDIGNFLTVVMTGLDSGTVYVFSIAALSNAGTGAIGPSSDPVTTLPSLQQSASIGSALTNFPGKTVDCQSKCPYANGSPCNSGNGAGTCSCDSITCKCSDGWFGADCSKRLCAGSAVVRPGQYGFVGAAWGRGAASSGVGGQTEESLTPIVDSQYIHCSGKGTCDFTTGVCSCVSGYDGAACDRIQCPTFGGSECNRPIGECDKGECVCLIDGWTGKTCSDQRCPNNCSDRGVCSNGVCQCLSGSDSNGYAYRYSGLDCSLRSCPSDCNGPGQGSCDYSTGTCTCNDRYYGVACDKKRCPTSKMNPLVECSGMGACDTTTGMCGCGGGVTGDACDIIVAK